jgi:hypothetical protein
LQLLLLFWLGFFASQHHRFTLVFAEYSLYFLRSDHSILHFFDLIFGLEFNVKIKTNWNSANRAVLVAQILLDSNLTHWTTQWEEFRLLHTAKCGAGVSSG